MRSGFKARGSGLALLLACVWSAGASGEDASIAALGRIEPRAGVARLAGPSRSVVVISELTVEEGDRVEKGQALAELDSHRLQQARVTEAEAVLERAEREAARSKRLRAGDAASKAKQEDAEMELQIARARLEAARAELDQSLVRAPFSGQVLVIHAREGERLGPEGLLELGRTDEMFVVAEVYETDVASRRRRDSGRRWSAVRLSRPSRSKVRVEHVGLRVGKMDVLGTDPVAKTDARVIEVEIRLDDAKAAAAVLTNLQVKVEIRP